MRKAKDLTGQKFGRLLVLERKGYSKNKHILWLCKCDCGNFTIVRVDYLNNGKSKSCGCYHSEICRKNIVKVSNPPIHNLSNTRLYKIWSSMKDRCYNSNNVNYKNYGGRGIKVCSEWKKDFMNFYNWSIKNGYKSNLTIDRIDVNGNYEPDNCRWATIKEQVYNKRNTIRIKYNNKSYNLYELSKIYNISTMNLYYRLKRGWSIDRILNTPVKSELKEVGDII